MAEIVAGVAAASAFLSLISFASDLLKHLSALEADLKRMPSSLTRLAANIALLKDTLTKSQQILTGDRISPDTQLAIDKVIGSCTNQFQILDAILQKSAVSARDSRWRKGRKALKLALNDKKIDEAEKALRDHVQALTFYQTTAMMADDSATTRSERSEEIFKLPFTLQGIPVAAQYVAREGELHRIEQLLVVQDPASSPLTRRRHTVVVHGLGGMGKTQLIVEYIRRHHQAYSSVIWLDARTEQALQTSFATFAARIPGLNVRDGTVQSFEHFVHAVVRWLDVYENSEWLLIIDNYDTDSRRDATGGFDLLNYLPAADHGSVIITTRLTRLASLGHSVKLDRMETKLSTRILEARTGRPLLSTDAEHVNKLVSLLDGLPLALAQAGAYIRETSCSIEEYCKFYSDNWARLMEMADKDDLMRTEYHNGSIWTTWSITFQRIESLNSRAANMLRLWSFLDERDVWHELIATSYRLPDETASTVPWFGELSDAMTFTQTMGVLVSHSLIERRAGTSSYTMHPVLHQWLKHSLTIADTWRYADLACYIVASNVPWMTHQRYWIQQKRLLPHALRCFDFYSHETLIDTKLLNALTELAAFFKEYDILDKAEELLNRLVGVIRASYEPPSVIDRHILANLGGVKVSQRAYAEATALYEEAIADSPSSSSMLGLVVSSKGNLARILDAEKEPHKALALYEEAVRDAEQYLGRDHFDSVEALRALSDSQFELNMFAQAEANYRRCVLVYTTRLTIEHPLTLQAMQKLAETLGELDLKKIEEAERLLRQVCAVYFRLFDASDERLLQASIKLCSMLYDQKKYERAAEHCKSIIDAQEKYDPNSWGQCWIRQHYARTLLALDEPILARTIFETVYEGTRIAMGESHMWTLGALSNIGTTYAQPDGLWYYEKAYGGYAATSSLGDSAAFDTMVNLGLSYAKLSRPKEAETMFRTAVDGYVVVDGLKKQYTQNAIVCLTKFLGDQGRPKDAAAIVEDYQTRCEELLGPKHAFTIDLMGKAAGHWSAARQFDKAQTLYERCLSIMGTQDPVDEKEVALLRYNLANVYEDQGDLEKAVKFYETSLEIRLRVLDQPHAHVADNMGNLALLLYNQGQLQRAVELMEASQQARKQVDPEKFKLVVDAGIVDRWRKELAESMAVGNAGPADADGGAQEP